MGLVPWTTDHGRLHGSKGNSWQPPGPQHEAHGSCQHVAPQCNRETLANKALHKTAASSWHLNECTTVVTHNVRSTLQLTCF